MKSLGTPLTLEKAFILLLRSGALAEKFVAESIVQYGVTVTEYNFLRIVELVPDVTASDLQKVLNAAAPSIAQMVARLEKKKLIKRERSSDDGRVLFVQLTFWGKRAVRKAKASIEQRLKKLKLGPKLLTMITSELEAFINHLSRADTSVE